MRRRRKENGFTLIELLVVIAIIGILAAVALPKLFTAICDGRVSSAEGTIGAFNSAITMYIGSITRGTAPTTLATLAVSGIDLMGQIPTTGLKSNGGAFTYNRIGTGDWSLSFVIDAGSTDCSPTGITSPTTFLFNTSSGAWTQK